MRGYIAEHLVFLFGDDLEKNPQLTRSLVNVLEFFYTQGSNNGDGTVSIQVNKNSNGGAELVCECD